MKQMVMFKFAQHTNVSLRERVTADIREAILKGKLKPGERLKEIEISEQMGVSRGPIREAIRQLEREGLLISHPYRETVVNDLRAEEVNDVLIPIRFQLEWFVIKNYMTVFTDKTYAQLQEIVIEMEICAETSRIDRMVELDIQFHQLIIDFAKERTVTLTWQSILNQIRLHFIKNVEFYDIKSFKNDHQALLNTIKSGNLDDIQKELHRHMKCDESFLCFVN